MSAVLEKKNDLPDGWQSLAIDDIAEVNPRVNKSDISDDLAVSFVPMPAVEAESGAIDVSQERPFSEVKKGFTPFKEGDVLFAKITPCMENGKMAVVPKVKNGYGFGSTEFHVLRPKDGIEAKWIYYFVSSRTFRGVAQHHMSGAVGQKRVPTNYLKQHLIPVAPPEQQKRIVAKIEELFSHIDAGIEALKKAKQLLKQYRQSVLKAAVTGKLTEQWRADRKAELDAQGSANAAVGRKPGAATKESSKFETAQELLERILKERRQKWEEQQLEQFKAKGKMPKDDKWKGKYKDPEELQLDTEDENIPAEWVTASLEMFGELYCGQSPSVSQVNTEGKGVFYVTGPEQWNGKDIEARKWTEHPKRLVPEGCIFITVKGAGVGKLFPGVACAIGRDVYAFKPHDELDVRYVINVLQHGINLVIAKAQGDIPGLSRNHIMEHAVGLPSIEEQKIICDYLEEKIITIDRLEQSIDEQLIKSEKNKQSVLASAFSGDLY